jgi:3-oxoadipate enol-lactonase
MEGRRVVAGAVGLEIAEAGVGGRPLLLVHGFTGAKEDFRDWLDPLAERGWHAVAPDLRGHGSSDQPSQESEYSLEVFAADLAALVDQLEWPRYVLLGHSMGGMIAQVIALSPWGRRLDGLVLMDTGHARVDGIDRGIVELGIDIVRGTGMQGLLDVLAQLGDAKPLSSAADQRLRAERPEYVAEGERKLLASSPAMWVAMTKELLDRPDLLPGLERLNLPTLVIVGEQDTPFLEPSRRMAEVIPGARLEVVAGGGHSPQVESPEAWWKALTGFLDER